MAFVEPCCVENVLPRMLRSSGGAAMFQTQGDVTMKGLMGALCCVANAGFGEYWICVKEVDITLMRFLKRWFDRGWIRRLHLLTDGDQSELVASELGEAWMKQTEYGWRKGQQMELFCVVGDTETVVVSGPMLLQASSKSSIANYSALSGSVSRLMGSEGIVGSLVGILQSLFRVQQKKSEAAEPKKKTAKKKDEPKAEESDGQPTAEAAEQPTE